MQRKSGGTGFVMYGNSEVFSGCTMCCRSHCAVSEVSCVSVVAPGVGLGSEGRVSWEGFGISGAFIYGGSTVVLGTHFPGTGSFLGEYSELCFVASGICCGMLTVFSGVSVDSLPGILIGISEHPQSANAAQKAIPRMIWNFILDRHLLSRQRYSNS